MTVYFLTEYSKDIGFGHLSRCLSLASAFYERNYEVIFLIREWKEEPLELEFQKKKIDWSNTEVLSSVVSEQDILIIDSYRVPTEILNKIALGHKKTVSITDSKRNHADAGMIVFGSVYGNERDLSASKAQVFAGPKYILFRKGIRETPTKELNKNIQEVMINLGGYADPSVLNKVIQLVQGHLRNCRIKIVGKSKVVNSPGIENKGFLKLPDLLKELNTTDLIITNGGQSLNEAIQLGIPTIGISVADNQDMNLKAWHKLGVVKNVMRSASPDFQEKFLDSLDELKNYNRRLERVKKGRSLIDSNGANRVVEKVEEMSKNTIK